MTGGWAMRTRLALVVVTGSVLFAAARARAATLPNELSGDVPLTVIARGAAGPYYRPGTWMVLKVTIENRGPPFAASVHVRETRGRRETLFLGAARTELRRGTSALDLVLAPGGPAAGATLEIVRLGPGEDSREVVYRGDLSRVLKPLGTGQALVLGVGLHAFGAHLVPGSVVWSIDPRESPERAEAYAAADLTVVEEAGRESVTAAQARALVDHVRGGGTVLLASFRALEALRLPRSFVEGRSPTLLRPTEGDGAGAYYSCTIGGGRLHVFPVEVGDASAWRSRKGLVRYFGEIVGRKREVPWIDAAAFDALAPARPFSRGASRARTVAIAGALVAMVAVALLARRTRRLAGAGIAGTAVAWAIIATVVWQRPPGASRIVRARAFTADGRAEVVTDSAVLAAFEKETAFAFETTTGPVLPVARRAGEAAAKAFVLEERGLRRAHSSRDTWRISSLRCPQGEIAIARAVAAREPAPESTPLRKRLLVRGARVRITDLPGGRRKAEPVSGALPVHVRYLLERLAPSAPEVAWAWVEGMPEGARVPGC
ncbi:MAG: hypothetical protein ACYTFI_24255, partial [Planctomycetota bacterium]